MESVINRIIEIDKNATERINSASEKRNQIIEDTKKQCMEIRTKIERDADFNKSEFEKEVSELEKKFNDEINEMNAFYDYNHETIEKEILAEIVGE